MNRKSRWIAHAALLLGVSALPVFPQETSTAFLNQATLLKTIARARQLMESAAVTIPDLSRAGAPLIENLKQAYGNLQESAGNLEFNYSAMMNVRAFVMLVDSVPKPFPFPDEAQRQLTELRELPARLDAHFRALLARTDQQVHSPDPDQLMRYAEANLKIQAPQTGKPRVVFLGDSITDFWRLNEYFPERDFVNRGISGQITEQMLGRIKADVLDLNPAAVVILGGVNDLNRGVPVSVIENNYQLIADLVEAHNIKVIFASVLPVSDYHKDQNPAWENTVHRPPILIRALNEWLKSYCSQKNYRYLDYYSAVVDPDGFLKTDFSDDGLHPNGAAYRAMAPAALEAIDKTVSPAPQQKPKKRRLFPVKDNE